MESPQSWNSSPISLLETTLITTTSTFSIIPTSWVVLTTRKTNSARLYELASKDGIVVGVRIMGGVSMDNTSQGSHSRHTQFSRHSPSSGGASSTNKVVRRRSRITSTHQCRSCSCQWGRSARYSRYRLCPLHSICHLPQNPSQEDCLSAYQHLEIAVSQLLWRCTRRGFQRRPSVPPQQPHRAPQEVSKAQGCPEYDGSSTHISQSGEGQRAGRFGTSFV